MDLGDQSWSDRGEIYLLLRLPPSPPVGPHQGLAIFSSVELGENIEGVGIRVHPMAVVSNHKEFP